MAIRSGLARTPRQLSAFAMGDLRCLSDTVGRVLGEEERAIENVYIQKMERERLEKLRKKAEKERLMDALKSKSTTEKKPKEIHAGS